MKRAALETDVQRQQRLKLVADVKVIQDLLPLAVKRWINMPPSLAMRQVAAIRRLLEKYSER